LGFSFRVMLFFYIKRSVIVKKSIVPNSVGNRIANENSVFADFVGTKFSIGLGAINAILFINNLNTAFVV